MSDVTSLLCHFSKLECEFAWLVSFQEVEGDNIPGLEILCEWKRL